MNIFDCFTPSEELGMRFLMFRKTIRKDRSDLSKELGIETKEIEAMERGIEEPEINYLHYLGETYDLNLNWLLCREGQMFNSGWLPPGRLTEEERRDEGLGEDLSQLLQIPVVQRAVTENLKKIIDQWIKEG
ncbi:MAG: hypothetical protein ACM3SY_22750 [Candidatus Omnitrophota bacterium]